MHITPEHQELQEKYQKLVLRVYQHDQVLQAKDEAIEQLKAQITPLKTTNEEFTSLARQLQEQITSLLEIVREKDRQLQKLELIEHQYEQLKRLLYSRSSERSLTAIPGHSLAITYHMQVCRLSSRSDLFISYTLHYKTSFAFCMILYPLTFRLSSQKALPFEASNRVYLVP